ncbi:type VII secretion protein EccB, partial [Micromonospora sp. NPDC000018]
MWTQRDQLQAYQFLRRRLVSALQVGDANHPVSPSRRLVIGCALGAAVALLVTAGFGVYGFLRPGANTDWRKPGQVVIDKDTGAAYVMGADGLLHPMLNYASARLLAGGDGTATSRVSSKSLARAPRGVPLGIPGAPPALPSRDRLVTGPF